MVHFYMATNWLVTKFSCPAHKIVALKYPNWLCLTNDYESNH